MAKDSLLFLLERVRRDIWRNKGRSLLMLIISILLILCMGLYMGNILRNEETLSKLADTIPITVQVTTADGELQEGLQITAERVDGLLGWNIVDPVYTAYLGGNVDPINQLENVRVCDTRLQGINTLAALPSLKADRITFIDGWDESFVTGDQAVCIVDDAHAVRYGIETGEKLKFPVYRARFGNDRGRIQWAGVGEAELTVVGTYNRGADTGMGSYEIVVPVAWMRAFVEGGNNPFTYDSFRCRLEDARNLKGFEAAMKELNFRAVSPNSRQTYNGDALIVNDKIYTETAMRIGANLSNLRRFQIPFAVILTVLMALVTFLNLRSCRRDMAIARSLGCPKGSSALEYYLTTIVLVLVGCLPTLPALLAGVGVSLASSLWICLLFLLCASVGIWAALAMLLHFDAIGLLTRID